VPFPAAPALHIVAPNPVATVTSAADQMDS